VLFFAIVVPKTNSVRAIECCPGHQPNKVAQIHGKQAEVDRGLLLLSKFQCNSLADSRFRQLFFLHQTFWDISLGLV
jgi:hypothetical protein